MDEEGIEDFETAWHVVVKWDNLVQPEFIVKEDGAGWFSNPS